MQHHIYKLSHILYDPYFSNFLFLLLTEIMNYWKHFVTLPTTRFTHINNFYLIGNCAV